MGFHFVRRTKIRIGASDSFLPPWGTCNSGRDLTEAVTSWPANRRDEVRARENKVIRVEDGPAAPSQSLVQSFASTEYGLAGTSKLTMNDHAPSSITALYPEKPTIVTYTVDEVADRLRCSVRHVCRLADKLAEFCGLTLLVSEAREKLRE